MSKRRRLFRYLTPYRGTFAFAILCMIIFGASDGIVPFLVKNILDGIFANQDKSLLYLLPALIVGFALVRGFSDFGQQFLMARIGHNVVRDLRSELNRHLLSLPPSYFVENSAANIVARFTSDVILIRSLLTECIASVLRDSIRIVALIGAALYLDPMLALIAIVFFPIGVVPVLKIGKRLRRLGKQGQDSIGALSALLQEAILGSRVVRIFGRENFEAQRFDSENDRLTTTFVKSERARALTGPINEVLASLAVSGVILYGGLSVIAGTRTQGDFIAFLLSVFLIYDPFKKLSRVHTVIQQGLGGADRIFEIFDIVSPVKDPEKPRKLSDSNGISFNNVTFVYPGANYEALSGIRLEVPEGKRTAIVGFSGAGKSTLIDLIPRFIDPSSGQVTVGGVDIKEVSLNELRSRIALVGQHTFLFNDTITNNIRYGNENATEKDVIEAAKAAFAFDFIQSLPNGFETTIGEGGYALSGGERQRIAIARALLKNTPILILDEATASLDNRSEREVQSALEKLSEGRTTIVIAHRLSTVRTADSIVVMKEGRIVEQGGYEELLTKEGEFATLHLLQFQSHVAEGDETDLSTNPH